jgi:hypothetical protein
MLCLGRRDNLVVMGCCVGSRDHQPDVANFVGSVNAIETQSVNHVYLSCQHVVVITYHVRIISVVDVLNSVIPESRLSHTITRPQGYSKMDRRILRFAINLGLV